MNDETNMFCRSPRAFETIVYSGLAIGILDFIDAKQFFPLYYGIAFQRYGGDLHPEFSVARLPRRRLEFCIFGIFLHFAVAFCIATVYYMVPAIFLFSSGILSFPVLFFGVIANYVMQCVVIPLSARGGRSCGIFSGPVGSMLNSIIGHAVGWPCCIDRGVVGEKE
jgi:hypothetical protein